MRVALLSYRSKPHCGGQGIYIRHLSRELTNLGPHRRGVLRPALPGARRGRGADQGARASTSTASPTRSGCRSSRSSATGSTSRSSPPCARPASPSPRRSACARRASCAERVDDFDIVHDNQVLGYGMLEIEKMGLPLLTTMHHPITFDRRIDIAPTKNPWRKFTLSRWYGFLRMQARVARQARKILTPSETSKRDIAKDFGVDPDADAGDPARRRRRASCRRPSRGCPAGSWRWPAPTPR